MPGKILLLPMVVLLAVFVMAAGCVIESKEMPDPATGPVGNFQTTVVRVVDGDTVRVALPGGNDAPLRIIGIDTPELDPEENEAGLFDGISDRQFLSRRGEDARDYLASIALGQRADVIYDPGAGTRDRYGRILAYLRLGNGSDAGTLILQNGLARVYTQETFWRKQQYLAIQQEAMLEHTGIWSGIPPQLAAAAGVIIRDVHPDASGDDRSNLNDEYIVIGNGGAAGVPLSGWQIRDNGMMVFRFGDVTLEPGGQIVVRTGSGSPGSGMLFIGSDIPLLNNEAGTVTLADPSGREISRRSWGQEP